MMDPILVVGPGRCGTSCVAGVLCRLGVFMGSRLVGADPTNPEGHFEDLEFVQLNAQRLRCAIDRRAWMDRVEQLAAARRAMGVPWGWKDPRTSNLLRDYLEIFDNPRFVRCTRDAAAIEDSILRAYGHRGFTPQMARALRVERERELERYLPWYDVIEVRFEDLRAYRGRTVRSLAEFCELDVPEETVAEAVRSIRPESRLPRYGAPGQIAPVNRTT